MPQKSPPLYLRPCAHFPRVLALDPDEFSGANTLLILLLHKLRYISINFYRRKMLYPSPSPSPTQATLLEHVTVTPGLTAVVSACHRPPVRYKKKKRSHREPYPSRCAQYSILFGSCFRFRFQISYPPQLFGRRPTFRFYREHGTLKVDESGRNLNRPGGSSSLAEQRSIRERQITQSDRIA